MKFSSTSDNCEERDLFRHKTSLAEFLRAREYGNCISFIARPSESQTVPAQYSRSIGNSFRLMRLRAANRGTLFPQIAYTRVYPAIFSRNCVKRETLSREETTLSTARVRSVSVLLEFASRFFRSRLFSRVWFSGGYESVYTVDSCENSYFWKRDWKRGNRGGNRSTVDRGFLWKFVDIHISERRHQKQKRGRNYRKIYL